MNDVRAKSCPAVAFEVLFFGDQSRCSKLERVRLFRS